MSNFQILNNVDHKDLRIVEAAGREFGDAIHSCPAYTFEFRDLQVDFPLLLQATDQDGLIPVAVMGFESGENLFLKESEWTALSRPAFMRKGPFLIGQHQSQEGEEVRLLSVDMAHPRVSQGTEGEAVFQPPGYKNIGTDPATLRSLELQPAECRPGSLCPDTHTTNYRAMCVLFVSWFSRYLLCFDTY